MSLGEICLKCGQEIKTGERVTGTYVGTYEGALRGGITQVNIISHEHLTDCQEKANTEKKVCYSPLDYCAHTGGKFTDEEHTCLKPWVRCSAQNGEGGEDLRTLYGKDVKK